MTVAAKRMIQTVKWFKCCYWVKIAQLEKANQIKRKDRKNCCII